MKTYFDMFWTIHGKYNRLQCSSTVCNTFPIFWDQFNSSLKSYHNLSLPRNSVNMISSLKMVIPLLFLVILGCDGVSRDIENFLRDQGLKNLTQTFVSEEIEVRHVDRLTDQNLILFLRKKLSCQILLCILSHQISWWVLSHILHFVHLCKPKGWWSRSPWGCKQRCWGSGDFSVLVLCTFSESLFLNDFPHTVQIIHISYGLYSCAVLATHYLGKICHNIYNQFIFVMI